MNLLTGEALGNVPLHGVQHDLFRALPAPRLGKSVQLRPLDGQNRLDVQHSADSGSGGGDPPTLFQIFQGVHRDVNAGLQPLPHQHVMNGLPVHTGPGHLQSVQDALPLGDGNTLVVHHENPPPVVGGEHQRRLAGGRQSAGHGDIDHLVMTLQQLLPQIGDVPRRGLGGGDVRVLRQTAVKRLLGEGHVLKKQFFIDVEGHGQHPDAQCLSLRLGDAAVAVSCNRYFFHEKTPLDRSGGFLKISFGTRPARFIAAPAPYAAYR